MKMAPKKNVEGKTPAPTKKAQQKKLKEKQLKPKLKTPTVVKVKIPLGGSISKNLAMSPKTGKPPKIQRHVDLETKIVLANEVAAAQLTKTNPASNTELAQNVMVKVPQKRGRKKKSEMPAATSGDSEDAFEASPVKKKVRKEPLKVTKKKPAVSKVANVKKPLSQKKTPKENKTTDEKPQKKVKKVVTNKKPTTAGPKTRKSKLNPEQGKELDISPNKKGQSPSLLNEKDMKLVTDSGLHNVEAGAIDSRKTSVNSELSWTKDISSSSTTTCRTVCSTDFVRIDKKIPILKLPREPPLVIPKVETSTRSSSSSSESSDSDQTVDDKPDRESTPDVECRSLNLSTSSLTPSKSISSFQTSDQISVTDKETGITAKTSLKIRLNGALKKVDHEILNWIGYENEENVSVLMIRLQGNILKLMKPEIEIITSCCHLKNVFSENHGTVNVVEAPDRVDEVDNVKECNKQTTYKDVDGKDLDSPKQNSDDENNFTSDRVKYKSFEQNYDDDDALSLFAESITGIESSRNSCAASVDNPADVEEYIPQYISAEREQHKQPNYVYVPTAYSHPKIAITHKPHTDAKTKTVCEKQNADSTSIYKDAEQEKCIPGPFVDRLIRANQTISNLNAKIRQNISFTKKLPGLMTLTYKQSQGTKSIVLRGICFFNLLNSCKNPSCRYPHDVPTHNDIKVKLMRLSEEMFIQEYMLFRNWPELRRMYGMCFVEECRRRDLTRILVEMAIDFVMKESPNVKEDEELKVEVAELTLLYLNDVNLDSCEDLLMYNVKQGVPLCDFFMQTIADTQNFSRFKPVFIKLTNFILCHNRTFSFDVATQILERLSILPCEQPLLEALLEIVKHTDRKIVSNSMMGHFEKQLLGMKDLHDQLLELKNEVSVGRPVLSNLYESSPRRQPDIEPLMSNTFVPTEREKRYTSPDTTNLDNMKTMDEPIPQTVENRSQLFKIQRTFTNSNSSSESEELRPNERERERVNGPGVIKNPNFKNWMGMSIFNTLRGKSPRHPSPRGRQVYHRSYGSSQPTFSRRSGQDFY